MTRHEHLLVEELAPLLGETTPILLAEKLLLSGLINLKICEQRAMRREINQLERKGTPRCEAMHVTAEKFCCSYEKVRGAFYEKQNPQKP